MTFDGPIPLPPENIYGHLERVHWMRRHLQSDARIIEVGCGTGYGITFPLLRWGYDAVGIDTDAESVEYGRKLFRGADFQDVLYVRRLEEMPGEFDAVIISEVLEHLANADIDELLATAHAKLRPGGVLLVTVPNGWGWFELESFLWYRVGLGLPLTYTGVAYLVRRLKRLLVKGSPYSPIRTSLWASPHVQRFTLRSICRRISRFGFVIQERTGSALFCGPFSDTVFTGAESVMRFDRFLGQRFPAIASGFYIAARKP